MKLASWRSVTAALLLAIETQATVRFLGFVPAAAPAPAPAAATEAVAAVTGSSRNRTAGQKKAALKLPGVSVRFEMANINYFDLEKKLPPRILASSGNGGASKKKVDSADDDASSNVGHGAQVLGRHISDAHRAVSRAFRDTVHKNSKHVKNKVTEHSKVLHNGIAHSARSSHETIADAAQLSHETASGAAHAVHHGVHGEDKEVPLQTAELLEYGYRTLLVEDLVRRAVEESFEESIDAAAAQSARAAPAPAAFVESSVGAVGVSAPAPAPAPAEASAVVDQASLPTSAAPATPAAAAAAPVGMVPQPVSVFVQFRPGLEKKKIGVQPVSAAGMPPPLPHASKKQQRIDQEAVLRHANPLRKDQKHGRSTIVEVVITDVRGTGSNDLPLVAALVQRATNDGTLQAILGDKLDHVVGLRPLLQDLRIGDASIAQWSVSDCEEHMAKVVKRMAVAYTARMVPMAILNECTNIMTAMSFSHDRYPTALDVQRCNEATQRFSKAWNFGDGPGTASTPSSGLAFPEIAKAPEYMNAFCVDVCESKFGERAPMCHVTEGERRLLRAP
eukprot:TRINITY_DN22488_c0_g2_i1.p1 TRINITY_DN22488_c0_g2~~TRINITY_DN22488_c0_g2_i1.p1  ORF type:complete len:589 (-),score=151.77 TRINITY_DN22488_c0_g2_i1:43-1728(-)